MEKTINNNIKEARVGFENSKLLKEKGFNVKCTHYYILNFSSFKADFILNQFKTPIEDNKNILQLCNTKQPHIALAPTQQSALDWIKINFGVHIGIFKQRHSELKHYGFIIKSENDKEIRMCGFLTPEEAKEAAINHVLTKLI